MSRIGRQPVALASGVNFTIQGNTVTVKGPKGQLQREFHPEISIENNDGTIVVKRPDDQPKHRALHGLSRSLLFNMVQGVSTGFVKVLEIQGVGYRVAQTGTTQS